MPHQRYTWSIHSYKKLSVTYQITDTTGQEPPRLYTFTEPQAPYLGFPNAELAVGSECDRLNKKHNLSQQS